MLTDTTFWIDLLKERRDRSKGPASEFLARNRSSAIEMSIITWGELAGGFESSAEMDNLFRGARILHLHMQVAWEASRIERELRNQGGKLGENDNWIAATARIWGLRLVSRDEAFARVPNLDIVSY
ncbi:MAG TPA: type II toxin-antitoxin system VapC family toxin [Candidatus Saccharimonadales bacterium]|nr:type II toxin-antitoxin system VapC family toxin [Candidatus Saccharimonadales bacterium]